MPLDPRIILKAGQLGSPQAFNSILQGIQGLKAERERKALMPLEIQLKEAQLGRQQQALSADELRNNTTRRNDFITSTAQGAQEFLPRLKAGDIIGAGQALSQRRERLISQGLPTETTDEALELLDSNPDLLIQRAEQAIQAGQQLGQQSAGKSLGQKEFESLTSGLSEKDAEKARRIKLRLDQGAVGSASQTITNLGTATDVGETEKILGGAREEGKLGAQLKLKPQITRAVKLAEKEATERGDVLTDMARMTAALPGLKDAVGQLRGLAPIATSTFGGRVFDAAVKESGFGSTKGATAKAKFIAIIDNQVLPLLKPTFGAAFTVSEGEALKATMGNPNASIDEKLVQLDAFMAQKERSIRTAEAQIGQPQSGLNAPATVSGATPEETQRGGVLNVDAQGNRAVVFPDGTFREVN